MSKTKNWFESWFDTKYYHILYRDRDYEEAEFFIKNLTNYLKPKHNESILDLACGAGRHSIFMNSLGLNVTGVDLSNNSIETALKSKKENLNFDVHDMREVYKESSFNYIFNLFTSFGYFDSNDDNIRMLQSVDKTLKSGGVFVLDFFNSYKVIANLVKNEVKEVENIKFNLKREYKEGNIIKNINFEADGEMNSFMEKVQAVKLEEFQDLFSYTKMKIIATFGNYSLEQYDKEKSDRLIIIAQK